MIPLIVSALETVLKLRKKVWRNWRLEEKPKVSKPHHC